MNEIIEKINKNIDLTSIEGCEIWTGLLCQKNIPKLNHYKKGYSVPRFLWNYHNPNDQIDNLSYCKVTCGNRHCVKLEHLAKSPRKKEINLEDRYKKILEQTERQPNGCLHWTGRLGPNGYGLLTFNKTTTSVHRFVCMMKMGLKNLPTIQKDGDRNVRLFVRHLCNNKLCVDPSHLELGTQYQNDYDDKLANGTLQRGNIHYNSSITEEVAQAIKLSKPSKGDTNYKSQKERAKEFGVSRDIVKSIDCCKSWAFLPDKNGKTSSKRKIQTRSDRKNAKERVWTQEMWDKAKDVILTRSLLEITDNEFTGTPCRVWNKGKCTMSGYGRLTINGISIMPHILSCTIQNNYIRPEGLVARHLCGNKLCVREDHLKFGTVSENAIDNVIHGKSFARFTPQDILAIRQTYIDNNGDHISLAKQYNTTPQYIKQIIKKEIWKHI